MIIKNTAVKQLAIVTVLFGDMLYKNIVADNNLIRFLIEFLKSAYVEMNKILL